MARYEENCAWFGRADPALLQALQRASGAGRCRPETARSGLATLVYRSDGGDFLVHSRFDPAGEALAFAAGRNLGADYIVLLGLGLGYHVPAIIQNKRPSTRLLLVEPDLEIAHASLHTLPWAEILERPDCFCFFGTDLNALAGVFQRFFNFVSEQPPEFIEWPAAGRLFRRQFDGIRERIGDETRILVNDFKTKQLESAFVARNVLRNTAALLGTRPVRHLQGAFAGVPGFIVGAGPSLDANVLQLQAVADRAVIICVDTALKPLLARGIQPHFTVVADPSYKNYLHLQGTEKRLRHWLVTEPAVAAPIYRDFGDRIFSASIGRPLVRLIEENSQPLGEIEAWGSVISLAVGLAALLGLDPVVFLGQDFAFTQMRNHCRGTSWEERWLESTGELDDLQRREAQSIRGNTRVIETADIFGRPTLTSDRLLMYKTYLARIVAAQPQRRFVNASAGGIFADIPWQPLEQVMAEHVAGRPALDFSVLRRAPGVATLEQRARLVTFFRAKADFFRKYGRRVERMLQRLESGDDAPLVEAERLKDQLYDNPQNGEIAEMWSQNPIYDYLRRQRERERSPQPEQPGAAIKMVAGYFAALLPQLREIEREFQGTAAALAGPA